MNQKGFAHIFLVFVLLVGIVAGVYLVQNRTNIFSKASVALPTAPETSFTLVDVNDSSCDGILCKVFTPGAVNGSVVKVDLIARSDIETANLFSAKINFPIDLLEVTAIETTSGQSVIKNWVENTYDNSAGTISLVGGVPNPGIQSKTGEPGLYIATIIFRAKKEGKGTVLFTDSSTIFSNANNINILTIKRNLDLEISQAAPPTEVPGPTIVPTSSPIVTPMPGVGDGNNDNKTDLIDLSVLLSDMNKNTGFRKGIDMNKDGVINSFDFSLMRNLLIQNGVIKDSSTPPAAPPSPSPSPSPRAQEFVKVRGNKLYLGEREYVAKGINFAGGTYLKSNIKDGNGVEQVNRWQIYHDKNQPADATGYNGGDGFDSDKINQELAYLKNILGVNTIRIFTPSKGGFSDLVRWHGWDPWFKEDGSINPVYLNRLKAVIDLAGNNGIKVQLEILHNFHIVDGIGKSPLPSGSELERFYFNYIDSLVTSLVNNPNILSYEVGNETLINAGADVDNYWKHTDYEANLLSFETRMIRRIRSKDSNHLITTGEVVPPPGAPYNTAWHWPSPELGLIKDIDNLNNGNSFSLYSQVDYISPHFYLKSEEVSAALAAIKQKSSKPIVMGEFGYQYPVPDDFEITKSQAHILSQEQYYAAAINAVKNNQTSGLLAWDPVPMFSLQPDKVKIEASGANAILTLPGPPQRKIIFRNEWYSMYNDNFSILKWDGTFYPAGQVFKTAVLE